MATTVRAQPVARESRELAVTVPRGGGVTEKQHQLARELYASIREQLGDARFFTRDDLLFVSAFSDVATVTRINKVGQALYVLLRHRMVIRINRTDWCLPSKLNSYNTEAPLGVEFANTVWKLCQIAAMKNGNGKFIVMDAVVAWRTDQHITTNNKRVAVRQAVYRLVKEGRLKKSGDDSSSYVIVGGSNG